VCNLAEDKESWYLEERDAAGTVPMHGQAALIRQQLTEESSPFLRYG